MQLLAYDSDDNPVALSTLHVTGLDTTDNNSTLFIDVGASRYHIPVTDENREELEWLFDTDLRPVPRFEPPEEEMRKRRLAKVSFEMDNPGEKWVDDYPPFEDGSTFYDHYID